MFMLCLPYAGNRMEAEDFLQDGFVQVFKDLHQFDAVKGSLQGWVRKVILNKCLQHVRKKKLQYVNDDIGEMSNQLPTNENVISMLSAKEITLLIRKLPEGYRMVFNLFVYFSQTQRIFVQHACRKVNKVVEKHAVKMAHESSLGSSSASSTVKQFAQ